MFFVCVCWYFCCFGALCFSSLILSTCEWNTFQIQQTISKQPHSFKQKMYQAIFLQLVRELSIKKSNSRMFNVVLTILLRFLWPIKSIQLAQDPLVNWVYMTNNLGKVSLRSSSINMMIYQIQKNSFQDRSLSEATILSCIKTTKKRQ